MLSLFFLWLSSANWEISFSKLWFYVFRLLCNWSLFNPITDLLGLNVLWLPFWEIALAFITKYLFWNGTARTVLELASTSSFTSWSPKTRDLKSTNFFIKTSSYLSVRTYSLWVLNKLPRGFISWDKLGTKYVYIRNSLWSFPRERSANEWFIFCHLRTSTYCKSIERKIKTFEHVPRAQTLSILLRENFPSRFNRRWLNCRSVVRLFLDELFICVGNVWITWTSKTISIARNIRVATRNILRTFHAINNNKLHGITSLINNWHYVTEINEPCDVWSMKIIIISDKIHYIYLFTCRWGLSILDGKVLTDLMNCYLSKRCMI